ncbi:hypothetical protein MMC31_002812 [Peltigera leucophlebia]|nr:hypothetical protein [Peltigera leucophlebia]
MAILVLQLRIFAPKIWFRVAVYIGITLVTLVHWSNVPVYGILCTPRRDETWDMVLLSSKRCSAASTHTVVTGAIGTALDIYLLLLPLPIIAELNLAPRRKLGVALVFMAGVFAIIASACALYFRVVMWKGHDISWNAGKGVLCVFVETYVGIIVGCAPGVVALWKTGISKSNPFSSIRSLLSFSRFRTVRDSGKTERAYASGGDSYERLQGYRPVGGYHHIQGH